MKVILDSNVFDDVVKGKIDLDIFEKNNIEVCITHIQVDEINECPDKEKRALLFNSMTALRPEKIPSESFVIGMSRIGEAKITDGDHIIERLKNSNIKRTNDAIIGETAIKNDLILITNDKRFKNKVIELGGHAMDTEELIRNIGDGIKDKNFLYD